MSTESNDMNPIITRANYEEYFLMYVDNELTEQERAMVDAFLQFHPELRAELDLLMDTRLEPEVFSIDFKENLLAENIREQSIDEALLLHVDGELDEPGKKAVEEKLQRDEAYNRQHQMLLRTKSDPAEVVPYPNKNELYRHSVYRMRFGAALRVAAAVLVIAALGVLVVQQGGQQVSEQSMATTQPAATAKPQARTSDSSVEGKGAMEQAVQQPVIAAIENEAASGQPAVVAARRSTPGNAGSVVAPEQHAPVAKRMEEQPLAYTTAPRPNEQDMSSMEMIQKNEPPAVTTPAAETYDIAEPAPEPVFAAVKEKGGRGNIKSLLRKATRMVERRTGISTTNDDDELLIGVVALKLK